ncbi:class I SAM-dependent methyltransferase [Methanolacinia petrolearia]|uniref:class I SAM-dependent methyltransferase n=1 Tax=Methanolacinia petrolearia TaxID=54120 RepID=UPI003BA8D0C1
MINIDIKSYEDVNIIATGDFLPIKDNSVDAIINIAMLEHVPHPEKLVDEMYRVIKNNGYIYTAMPFI